MKNLKLDSTFVFKVKTTVGFLITLLVAGSIGWLSIKSMDESTRTQRALASSNRELTQISNLLQLLRQAEADHYSFVTIRSDPDQLDRYTASVNSVDRSLESLKKSFEGNPAQQKRLERIEPLVHEKLRIMSGVVQKHRRENPVDLKQEEFPRMDQINAGVAKIAAEMEAEENRLLADGEKLAQATAVRTRIMIVAGIALAIAIAGIARVVWGRDFRLARQGCDGHATPAKGVSRQSTQSND